MINNLKQNEINIIGGGCFHRNRNTQLVTLKYTDRDYYEVAIDHIGNGLIIFLIILAASAMRYLSLELEKQSLKYRTLLGYASSNAR